jgi:WD40 repeat protein
MSVDLLGDLLLRWEELREQGQAVTPEDLCRDCPELLPELRHRIQALQAMTRVLNDHAQSTVDAKGAASPKPREQPSGDFVVPGFEIVGELGRGGMGVVYKAKQLSLNRFVALKMILSGAHAGSSQRERFRREAEAAAHLKHPNIVQVYEVGEHKQHPYCALEYVEGRALNEVIRAGIPPFAWSAEIVEQLARAADYAHRRGIVHRDLKPGNILLSGECREAGSGPASEKDKQKPAKEEVAFLASIPKITDFGLAKRLGDSQVQTKTGDVLGTPSYMAPEQAAGKSREIGPPADIYALGVILYELLCGAPPFEGINTWDTVSQVLNREPAPPSRRNPRVPRDLETICLKCLQKEIGKRYATALELAEDLRRYANGEPIAARPVGRVERGIMWVRRRPGLSALLGACAVLLLVLLIGGWVMALNQARSNRELKQVNRANHDALVRLHVTQGLHYVEDEDLAGSLVWFARALTLDRNDAREPAHRLRLTSVLRQCPRLTQMWFHEGSVTQVAFSPDGRWVLTASDDGTARVWNAATGAARFEPLRHELSITSAAFSRDGKYIVTASSDKTAAVWDAVTGRRVATLIGHEKQVRAATLSADGSKIVSASADGTARVWDAVTGKLLGSPLRHQGPVVRACFHPDGTRVLTASEDGAAYVWRIETGAAQVQTKLTHDGPVRDAVFSPDGAMAATASDDGSARLWGTSTGRPLAAPFRHHGPVFQVAFRPDGQRLATASADLTVRLWECKNGKALPPVIRHYSSVTSVAFSADGMRLVTGSDDNSTRVWDAEDGRPITPPLPHNGEVVQACFSPDGRSIATAAEDTTARLYDLEVAEASIPTLNHKGPVLQASYDASGTRVLTASADGTARVWHGRTGKPIAELRGHQGAVLAASFSADGRFVGTAGADATVRIWDGRLYHLLQVLIGHVGPVRALTFSPDGGRTLTIGEDGAARIWECATGRALVVLNGTERAQRERINDAVFSPDGTRVVTSGSDGTVRLWDLASNQEIGHCKRHQRQVVGVVFSPDGRRIATASLDRTVRLVDASTPELAEIAILQHAGPVQGAVFRADGARLLTWSDDNTARVWDGDTGEPLLPPLRHYGSLTKACFSRDGTRLATASDDNTGRVWDAQTGVAITGPLNHHHWGKITDIAFEPTGDSVVTASADGTAEIWRLESIAAPAVILEQFAQLFCGMRISADAANLAPLDVGALRTLWEGLRSHHPELVGPRP